MAFSANASTVPAHAIPGAILALLVMASGCAEPARLERYDDGALARVSEWDGPLLDGRDLRLHEDGSPDRLGSWVQGRRTGLWLDWAPTGELIRAEEWRAGVREGRHRGWTEDGQPEFMGRWTENLRTGEWLTFGAGGVPGALQTYREGTLLEERPADASDLARLETLFADLVPEALPLDPGVEP